MPFTSDEFEDPRLPNPLPVVDIFWNWRYLSLCKLSLRASRLTPIVPLDRVLLWVFRAMPYLESKLLSALSRNKVEIPTFFTISIRVCLVPGHPWLHLLWWSLYFIFSDASDFEQNYLAAWSQQATTSVHIFVGSGYLHAPLPDHADDAKTLKHLRMYYRFSRAKRSLLEILLPKTLGRIDRVRVNDPVALGPKIETLDLGRSGRRLVKFFETPEILAGQHRLTDTLRDAAVTEGLEFVRFWDSILISAVVVVPFLMSLAFAAVWVGVFVARGKDLQSTMQTAFTVASFMVTAGALIIALVAFLEQTSRL